MTSACDRWTVFPLIEPGSRQKLPSIGLGYIFASVVVDSLDPARKRVSPRESFQLLSLFSSLDSQLMSFVFGLQNAGMESMLTRN